MERHHIEYSKEKRSLQDKFEREYFSIHSKLQDKNKDLEKQKHLLHESKVRRRKEVALAQVSKNKFVNEMAMMDEWLNKMAEEVLDAKRATNMAMTKARDNKNLAENHLTKLNQLKTLVKDVKDDLADKSHLRNKLENMGITCQEIRKERLIGRCCEQSHWPLHICILVCELLCNGVPPACVRETLQTTSSYFTGSVVTKLPSVSYMRECRTVLQILNDLLGAYKLRMNSTWNQLRTNGNTRRQIGF